jgi:hypothetical protein
MVRKDNYKTCSMCFKKDFKKMEKAKVCHPPTLFSISPIFARTSTATDWPGVSRTAR